MFLLIAPDKLKGSLSAADAANAIAVGVLAADPTAQIDLCPIADGGEGTVAALLQSLGGRLITRRVTGPLPEMKVDAGFGLLADGTTAVIETAAASGLALLHPADRNPLNTTTFSTGELIAAAVGEGAKKIILGLGGSATVDAGIGMLQALGFTLLTRDGQPTHPTEPLCGRDLCNVLMVKHGRGEITNGIEVIGLADVTHPLTGPIGAALTFGPQKGATPPIAVQIDSDLTDLAIRTGNTLPANHPGAGAAGGLGFAVLAFLNGSLTSGFDYIATTANLRSRLQHADLCITAEGCIDSQTAHGKAVIGIARLCKNAGVPCIALAGSLDFNIDSLAAEGLSACFSICDKPMTLQASTANAQRLLTAAAQSCVRLWAAGRRFCYMTDRLNVPECSKRFHFLNLN